MSKNYTWKCGNCFDLIPKLSEGSVAVVATDPPYGMGYQSGYRKEKHKTISGDKTPEEAQELLGKVLQALYPKLKNNAHIFVFCRWDIEAITQETIKSVGYTIRSSMVWVKNNHGCGDLKRMPGAKHERIIYGVKGDPFFVGERPTDVITASRIPTVKHPTEKPVGVMEQLIKPVTRQGDLVVDPFGGVGTTVIAAVSLMRKGWGCEIEEKYHEEGRRRLNGMLWA